MLNDKILMKTFQRTGTGVDGVDGEDVQDPACRPDTGLVIVQCLREASIEQLPLFINH